MTSSKAAAAKDKDQDKTPVAPDDAADETAEDTSEAAAASADKAPDKAPDKEAVEEVVSDCVVNGGKGMHVGRAVNGKVCSYHAMHYDPNGNKR